MGNISLCDYITVGLSIQPLVGIWVGSQFGAILSIGVLLDHSLTCLLVNACHFYKACIPRSRIDSGSHANAFLVCPPFPCLGTLLLAILVDVSRSHCDVYVRLYLHFPDSVGFSKHLDILCETPPTFCSFFYWK